MLRIQCLVRSCDSPAFLQAGRFLLFVLLLVSCRGTLQPGASRVLHVMGDPALRSEAGAGVFVGVSHACADESEARRDAELQARQAIIASLQTQIESEVLQNVRLDGKPSEILVASVEQEAQVRAISRNLISVQAEAWFIETRERMTDSGLRNEVQAWCRMRYTREQHTQLLQELLVAFEPPLEESLSRLERSPEQGLGECMRQGAQVRRQLAVLERYEGWTPGQQARLSAFRQRMDAGFAAQEIALNVRCEVDGAPRVTGLGPALAKELRKRLPMRILDQASLSTSPRLDVLLNVSSRMITGGLHAASATVEARLQDPSTATILWSAHEPGRHLSELRDAGGNPEAAISRLLGNDALAVRLPARLAEDLEAALFSVTSSTPSH